MLIFDPIAVKSGITVPKHDSLLPIGVDGRLYISKVTLEANFHIH